jgi:hypothetical protein
MGENVPASHVSQNEFPGLELIKPSWQLVQIVGPMSMDDNHVGYDVFPTSQVMQYVLPLSSVYLPLGHSRHCPPASKLPSGQSKHCVDPGAEYFPSWHAWHAAGVEAPTCREKVSWGQRVHEDEDAWAE